jgi:hypothetical protein
MDYGSPMIVDVRPSISIQRGGEEPGAACGMKSSELPNTALDCGAFSSRFPGVWFSFLTGQ